MNKNVMIVLVGGFVIAILVAVMVQAAFGSKGGNMVEVAVAAKPLTSGSQLKKEDVRWKKVPETAVFEGAIVKQEDAKLNSENLQGRLRRDIAANEPIVRAALATGARGNILAAAMEPGMRAVTIKGDADSLVAGFINPGDRVDVLLTYDVRVQADEADDVSSEVNRMATETILENIKVLAVDQMARKEDDKAKVSRTVTIEVDSKGAEKVALAAQMGELSLSLRGVGDNKTRGKSNSTTDVQISRVLQSVNSLKRNSGGNSGVVRVYEGDNIENVNVRR